VALNLRWNDPANIGKKVGTITSYAEEAAKGETGCWVPRPRFDNAEGDLKFDVGSSVLNTVTVKNSETGETRQTFIVSGNFLKNMDLQNFPFDVQVLDVWLRFPLPEDRCRVAPEAMAATGVDAGSSVFFRPSVMLLDWNVHVSKVSCEYVSMEKLGKEQAPKPQFVVNISVSRAWWHHVLHVVIVIAGLTTCNFAAFFVPHDDVSGRCKIILTLLLTVVATKFLLKESLPALPFTTPLDEYTYAAMFFFLLALVETTFVSTLKGDKGKESDVAYCYTWLALWASFNLAWSARVLHIVRMNSKRLSPITVYAGLGRITQKFTPPSLPGTHA